MVGQNLCLDFTLKGQVLLTFKQQVEIFMKLEYNYVMASVFPPSKLTFCHEYVT